MNPPAQLRLDLPTPDMGGPAPYACHTCDARWSGTTACHCTACHRTFTDIDAFDAHHAGGRGCTDPRRAGLIPRPAPGGTRWATPDRTDTTERTR